MKAARVDPPAGPLDLFETLHAGDLLFSDGSDVPKAASDVNWVLFEVLPRAARGVIIHVHDIFFPNDYPEDWIMNRGQTWNEQYILHALLAGGSNDRIVICNAMLGHLRRQDVEKLHKGVQPAYGCSIWLRKAWHRPARAAPIEDHWDGNILDAYGIPTIKKWVGNAFFHVAVIVYSI